MNNAEHLQKCKDNPKKKYDFYTFVLQIHRRFCSRRKLFTCDKFNGIVFSTIYSHLCIAYVPEATNWRIINSFLHHNMSFRYGSNWLIASSKKHSSAFRPRTFCLFLFGFDSIVSLRFAIASFRFFV